MGKQGLNIGLIGTGNMGGEIARIAPEKGHNIVAAFNRNRPLSEDSFNEEIDVCIDFSCPECVVNNVCMLANWGVPLVLGTTGWTARFAEVRAQVISSEMAIVHAPNFSIGVAVYLRIVREAGTLFNQLPDYDVFVHESHHRRKVDSPSGTALALGKILIDQLKRKSKIESDIAAGPIATEQLQVTSSRGGELPGTHSVFFDSLPDTIELRHIARNRSGFALGALLAAECVLGRQGVFTFDDVIEGLFE